MISKCYLNIKYLKLKKRKTRIQGFNKYKRYWHWSNVQCTEMEPLKKCEQFFFL